MLKLRLMGSKNDIAWFNKILERNSKIEIEELSDIFTIKGSNRFYRQYVEVSKSNIKEK